MPKKKGPTLAPNVKRVPLKDINPAPYNPRADLQPGDPDYEKIARSVEEFGLVEPLVWNQRTGNLVGGHQRLKVLEAAGETRASVVVVDLTKAREKVLNVALNKAQGRWDDLALATLLKPMTADDRTLAGFDADEWGTLEALLGDTGGPDPDDVPEVDEEADPTAQPGDLWEMGKHRVYCGDATSTDSYKRLFGSRKADLLVTDPPYGVSYTGKTKDASTAGCPERRTRPHRTAPRTPSGRSRGRRRAAPTRP